MKKYDIRVMYPGGTACMNYNLVGELTWFEAGMYQLTESNGIKHFFPIQFTIIKESK